MPRLDAIRKIIAEKGADAAVITSLPDIRWATGFSGSNGLLVVRPSGADFITDGRYTTQAAAEVEGAEVHIAPGPLEEFVTQRAFLAGAERILFQGDDVTVARFEALRRAAESAQWEGSRGLLNSLLASKSEEEIGAIRRAQAITEATFDHVLGVIKWGITEREIAAEIVYDQLRRGAERMSFDPIVASGPNGALPHARPSLRRIEPGDMIVLDFGCVVDGYASDMTRTVAVGEPDPEAEEAYHVVLEAQEKAIAGACAGMDALELDAIARDVIRGRGLGAYFTHSLGHGIGLETHEWPRVSHNSDDVLPEGAVITIEPGVYLPNRFGIRIEDMIVLRDGTAENLTTSPRNLIRL